MTLVSMLIAPLVGATITSTTNYTDDFNSYSDNSAPSGSWYTFYTNFTYAKVNRTIYASHPFYINASTTAPVKNIASFNFTSYAYDYFSFYLTYLNTYTARHNQSGMRFTLKGNSANIAYIDVFGANASVAGKKNRLLILDSTSAIASNVSIKNGVEYTITYTPDWDGNTLNIEVYNTSSSTVLTTVDVSLNSQTTLTRFFMENYPASQKVSIYLENFDLQKTYDNPEYVTTNYLLGLIPLFVAIAIFVTVTGIIFTMGLTKESLMSVMIITILGIVIIQVVLGL